MPALFFLRFDYFVETCAGIDPNNICAGVLYTIAQQEHIPNARRLSSGINVIAYMVITCELK
jgi:hypothetical protein